MFRTRSIQFWQFCSLLMVTLSLNAFADDSGQFLDATLVKFAQQRTNAVRITKVPVRMNDIAAMLCVSPPPDEQRMIQKEQKLGISNPHRPKYVHVYVTPDGASAMRTNLALFPRGTIILKEKFSDAEGRKTELFTGMVKREAGYNPDCGDWEFFTLPADASRITSRGKLQDCMACHVEYKDRDFVTKNYVWASGRNAASK